MSKYEHTLGIKSKIECEIGKGEEEEVAGKNTRRLNEITIDEIDLNALDIPNLSSHVFHLDPFVLVTITIYQ